MNEVLDKIKLTLSELEERKKTCEAELKDIQKQADKIHQEWVEAKTEEARKKIELLRENKDLILSLIEHDRTSCSDETPCNGYSYVSNRARCRKCFLIEILNGEFVGRLGDYDIKFDVSIDRIE